jgi:hypothetical protein
MTVWNTVVELPTYNVKAAFNRAKDEAYQEFYRYDFDIQLLTTTMSVNSNGDDAESVKFYYSFQITKT